MSDEAKKKVELVETLVDKIQEVKPLGTETKKKKDNCKYGKPDQTSLRIKGR